MGGLDPIRLARRFSAFIAHALPVQQRVSLSLAYSDACFIQSNCIV